MAARVYALTYTRPAGSREPGWVPPDWHEIALSHYWSRDPEDFRWPRDRMYLSYSGACKRASLLARLGCTDVHVVASEPIRWRVQA